MTNEEKAKEIALNTVGEKTRNHPSNILHIICVKDACLEMAQWKDKQYNEEKKELISLVNMLPVNDNNQTIIEDLIALLR